MMKKILMILLMTVLMAGVAIAGQHSVTVAWEYPDAPTDLAGYELQINGTLLEVTIEPDQLSWSGTLELSDGANTFVVRAFDDAEQRGSWSEPAGFDPVPGPPVITIIVVQ